MVSWKLIQKAKALLEKERGTVRKSWGGRLTVCLLYPNLYHAGMSNLGFQTIYQRLNARDDVVCERAFLPEPEDLMEYQRTRTPLFSLESQRPLTDFDLLAFSISFENDFLHVLTLLALAHLSPRRSERTERDPLVMGGGVAVFLNPEPLADFFDLFVLGEAEEVLEELLQILRASSSKQEVLKQASRIEGVYVPQFYHVSYGQEGKIEAVVPEEGLPKKIKRRWVATLDHFPTQSNLYTTETELRGMALIEVNRGCPRGCRFCAASFVYFPFRNRSLSLLRSVAGSVLSQESRIGLTGTAVSDYPDLVALCENILSLQGNLAMASLRVDAITPALLDCLKKGGIQSVALAPEAGTERLRRVLNKGYRDEEILRAVGMLWENGFSQIKNYFLIGLPSETDEEVRAILGLMNKARHQVALRRGAEKKSLKLILSVNVFVPKPATPFQWVPMERVSTLKRRLKILRNGVRGDKGVELIHDLPKWAYLQALLSRGDRRVGQILMEAHRWQGDWDRALKGVSLNPDFFIYRRRDLDEIFPWDFIDHGIPKEVLKEEYLKAMEEAGVTMSKEELSSSGERPEGV
ncbi:MAG: radical SAM protein [Desulfobacterota bacterium]|nr:radical SAM protein [Thermodesulfobacteriota bacterium]